MLFESLKKRFPKIKKDELLKNHCTFRVGGPADFFYELTNIEELPELIQFAEENRFPYVIFGRGTNMLFLDGGFRGLVIKNLSTRLTIEREMVTADSGVLLSEIIRKTVEAELAGLEPLYGLPGSIGGAVFGNAGVPAAEIGHFTKEISCFNIEEGIHAHLKEELEFSYRESRLKKEGKDVILTVTLQLQKGNREKSKEQMKLIDTIRRGKQPVGFTCGSFFKNPSKEKHAGMLIDHAGLKGFRIGDAQISEKHANFFINLGKARATDILELARITKEHVKDKFNIILEEEVRIIGENINVSRLSNMED